ncbi:MAG: DUF5317 domain-containing protein [Nitriliruptoraceae bacterium]
MPFTLAVLTLAIVLSWVRGGRLRRVADTEIIGGWLLFAGVAVQIGVDLSAGRGWLPDAGLSGWSLLLFSQLLVIAFVARNRRLPGIWLVAVGLLLNMAVMAANRAMPVDPAAMAAIGMEGAEVPLGKHTLLTGETLLPWLADIIPVPWLGSIVSVGDLVLAIGLIPLTHALMTAPPREDHANADPVDAVRRGEGRRIRPVVTPREVDALRQSARKRIRPVVRTRERGSRLRRPG